MLLISKMLGILQGIYNLLKIKSIHGEGGKGDLKVFLLLFFLRIVVFRLKNNFLFVKDNAAYWIVLGS